MSSNPAYNLPNTNHFFISLCIPIQFLSTDQFVSNTKKLARLNAIQLQVFGLEQHILLKHKPLKHPEMNQTN